MEFFEKLFVVGGASGCCTCSRKAEKEAPWDKDHSAREGLQESSRLGMPSRQTSGGSEKSLLGGVGIVFQGTEDGGLKVSSVMAGGPAAESGKVHSGDLLLTVNGVSIDGMTDQQLARNLLGPLGSEVTLGLESHDGTKVDAKLCRAHLSKQKQAPRA